jgi:hypothetical protein
VRFTASEGTPHGHFALLKVLTMLTMISVVILAYRAPKRLLDPFRNAGKIKGEA